MEDFDGYVQNELKGQREYGTVLWSIGAYKFTQLETNVITKLEQQDNEEFGVFVIETVLDKEGKENRKMLKIAMGISWWRTEFQIGCASPVSFISQTNLHDMKSRDRFLRVRKKPDEVRT